MILNKLRKQKFRYINKNWRIKNQILMIQVVCSLFVFIILATSIIVAQLIVQRCIEESSEKIFIKQTLQQLNSAWLLKSNLEYLIKSASQQIQIVKLLNIFTQKTEISIVKPSQCLNKPNTNDSYCYQSSYCFGLFGDQYEISHIEQLSYVFAITSTLTSFRIAMDNTQALYYSHANQAQFYTISQGFYFKPGFYPHQRPWYIYHLNSIHNGFDNDLIVYGQPYKIYYPEGIRIAITSNLINVNSTFEGVVAKDIDFNQTLNYKLVDQETTLIVINNQGQVIFSKLYDQQNQSIHQIFDETYTGFNYTDFEQIMNYHYHKNYSNTCNMIVEQDNVLCRYNSKLLDYCIIQTKQITNTPYILLLFKNTKNINMIQQQQFNFITNEQKQITQQNIIMYLLLTLAVLLFAYLMSNIMLKQLNLLISYTKNSIYDNWVVNLSLKAFMKQKYLLQSKDITNLYFSVIGLLHNLRPSKKNKQCQLEEDKLFPRSIKTKKFQQIKELINQIKEENLYPVISSN
ncbi:unnamed protein product [Paramecium sonneborni]|uniref:Transmembrane protein n=1 Tax=Paramecium sonneborni TaxID=65129 RepID=A0A8S1L6B1_9CILI|nr:unnamed protein product [Paramecium sonneborni]